MKKKEEVRYASLLFFAVNDFPDIKKIGCSSNEKPLYNIKQSVTPTHFHQTRRQILHS